MCIIYIHSCQHVSNSNAVRNRRVSTQQCERPRALCTARGGSRGGSWCWGHTPGQRRRSSGRGSQRKPSCCRCYSRCCRHTCAAQQHQHQPPLPMPAPDTGHRPPRPEAPTRAPSARGPVLPHARRCFRHAPAHAHCMTPQVPPSP